MACAGLLSLPDEILVKILRYALQNITTMAERSDTSWSAMVSGIMERSFPGRPLNGLDLISPQVLRVCRRLNLIGTPLLYESSAGIIFAIKLPADRPYDSDLKVEVKSRVHARLKSFWQARCKYDEQEPRNSSVVSIRATCRHGPDGERRHGGPAATRFRVYRYMREFRGWERVAVCLVHGAESGMNARGERIFLMFSPVARDLYADASLPTEDNSSLYEYAEWRVR